MKGLALFAVDADGRRLWTHRFAGRVVSDNQGPLHLAVGAGRIVLATALEGGVDFGGGRLTTRGGGVLGTDVLVACFDLQGKLLYAQRFGDESPQHLDGVVLSATGEVVLSGTYEGDLASPLLPPALGTVSGYLLALGPDGVPRWGRRLGADARVASQRGVSLALDPSGDLLVAFAYGGLLDLGAESLPSGRGERGVVARFTADGRAREVRSLPSATSWLAPAFVAAAHEGGLVVGGEFFGDVDLGGGAAAGGSPDLFALRWDGAARFVAGYSFAHPLGAASAWVARPGAGVAVATVRDSNREPVVWLLDDDLRLRRLLSLPAAALAFDASGRLVVAHRHGIEKLSSAGDLQSCLATDACHREGLCSLVDGRCVATADDGCRVSEACREGGRCRAEAGTCVLGTDADCAASAVCRLEGACRAQGGACVASASGCAASDGCREGAACAFVDGRCARPPGFDCRQSPECAGRGRCAHGDEDAWRCAPGDDADCRRSENCRVWGTCSAGPWGGECHVGSAVDCRRSLRCLRDGFCSFGHDEGGIGSCALLGEAQCRASGGCRERGRCTFVVTPEWGPTCEARTDADCAASEACKKLGRCRYEARLCVGP